MPLNRLDHYLILSNDVDKTRDFYVEVLGLEVGKRPPFPFPGYWLYLGQDPFVHLASSDLMAGGADYLDRGNNLQAKTSKRTGALDHIAFTADGLDDILGRLAAHGIEATRRTVPEQGMHQVFFDDPNGITIELNFAADELGDSAD